MRPPATLPHRPKTPTGACWCGASSDVRQVLRSQDVGVTWIERKRVVPAPAPHLRPLYPGALHRASLPPVGCQRFEVVPMAGDAPPPPHPHLAASVVPTDEARGPIGCSGLSARPAVPELGAPSVRRGGPTRPALPRPTRPGRSPSSPLRESTAARDRCSSASAPVRNAGGPNATERGSLDRGYTRISQGASDGRQSRLDSAPICARHRGRRSRFR
jgi:hypothetical protein